MAKKIMLVDDSITTLMMEQMILKNGTSYDIVTAIDGQEAVEKATQNPPDLVLMDVVMPRMNGFDACRALRKVQTMQSVPIVLVTTRGEEECVELGFESGCSDYITKPIDATELVSMVTSYLGAEQK